MRESIVLQNNRVMRLFKICLNKCTMDIDTFIIYEPLEVSSWALGLITPLSSLIATKVYIKIYPKNKNIILLFMYTVLSFTNKSY